MLGLCHSSDSTVRELGLCRYSNNQIYGCAMSMVLESELCCAISQMLHSELEMCHSWGSAIRELGMCHSSHSAVRFKKLCHSLGSAVPEIYICATVWFKKSEFGLCRISGWAASHCRGLGTIPWLYVWDLWLTKWQFGCFVCEHVTFLLPMLHTRHKVCIYAGWFESAVTRECLIPLL